MGEAQKWMFEPSFNRAIKVRGGDDRLTSDAGVFLQREADHQLGLTESLAARMHDPRNPAKIRYTIVELLRERIYAFGQGYRAQDDLDRLAHDPALRMAVWDRCGDTVLDERLASQPTQSRLIDTLVSYKSNREELRGALSDWLARHLRASGGDHAARRVTLDIDSFPLVVHGQQTGAKYNGYYKETVYHPLLASFSVNGDYDAFQDGGRLGNGFVHAILRAGNAHTAQGALRFIRTAVSRAAPLGYLIDVRLDAGFTSGKIMDGLSDDGQRFIGRLKSNPVLDRLAQPHLKTARRPTAGGGLRDARGIGPVPRRRLAACATLDSGSHRRARRQDGPVESIARLLLPDHQPNEGRFAGRVGTATLSEARHIRGPSRRVQRHCAAAVIVARI